MSSAAAPTTTMAPAAGQASPDANAVQCCHVDGYEPEVGALPTDDHTYEFVDRQGVYIPSTTQRAWQQKRDESCYASDLAGMFCPSPNDRGPRLAMATAHFKFMERRGICRTESLTSEIAALLAAF